MDVRYTAKQVEVYWQGERVNTHRRGVPGQRIVDPADIPADKLAFSRWTPPWCRDRARELGPSVGPVVEALLAVNTLTHRRQAQGILRLADTYGGLASMWTGQSGSMRPATARGARAIPDIGPSVGF